MSYLIQKTYPNEVIARQVNGIYQQNIHELRGLTESLDQTTHISSIQLDDLDDLLEKLTQNNHSNMIAVESFIQKYSN
jgi:hypothetical protein